MPVARAHHIDQLPRNALRSIGRCLARAHRQRFGVVDEDRIDIRRIIELLPAMLAQRDDGKAAHRLAGRALGEDVHQGCIERGIGKV